MNTKPSERIREISNELIEEHCRDCRLCGTVHHKPTVAEMFPDAITRYLDELDEQGRLIEHEFEDD